MSLKKLDPLSFAKLQALVFALLGFLAGILYSFGGFLIDLFVSLGWVSPVTASTSGLSYGTVLAFGALVGMPLILGTVGLLVGFVEALLFNVCAKWFGGMDIDFE